jgi:hydrogenase nickel incorporation protein HypA/HybF
MHEASIMKDLMGMIDRLVVDHRFTKVKKVKVKLGALSHFTPEHFQEHFYQAAVGTLFAESDLEIEQGMDSTSVDAQSLVLEAIEGECAD